MSVTTLRRPKPVSLQRPVGDGATAVSSSPAEWVRPSAWLALPDVTGQQKFAGLYLISKDGNFVALSAAGAYTVDWGDGTSTDHNSGTVAYKQYNYADIADTGESELGYRQVIIQVTPQAGQNLTSFSLQHRHNQTGLNTSYGSLWLDISINGSNLTSLSIGGSISLSALQRATILNHADTTLNDFFRNCRALRSVPLFNTASVTNMSSMFTGCSSLTTVPLFNTASVTNMSSMFSACSSLTTVPLFNTASVTNMNSMFINCSSLTSVPLFNTASVTDMASMFNTCSSLTSVPLFNTASVTSMSSMLLSCSNLTSVPLFNTSSVTSINSMLVGCSSLTSVPLFNTSSVTNMGTMLAGCSSLTSVPLFNTSSVNNMAFMFQNCPSLTTVPLFNTASVTSMSNMFTGCSSLKSVPLFNTASVTDMGSMFNNCYSLTSVPLFNTASVTNMSSMFNNCYSLTSVPLFNTSSVTSISSMLGGCVSLTSVPLFNTSSVNTGMNGMFSGCSSLTSVPLLDTSKVTTMTIMFSNCFSLTTVPLFNTASVTSMSNMFIGCSSLTTIPAMTAAAATTLGTVVSGGSLSWFDMTNINATITFASQKLSKAALDHIFTNLLRRTVSTTITISGNYGADTAISKTSCGTTAGSKVVTQANTASLAVGMRVLGVGVTDAVAVTFQDTGDTVTRTAHGLDNGTIVSFSSITSTTGILTWTQYYVINATTDTFQLAETSGGSAIALTTNGSGNMLYPSYITNITTNTSFEMSAPASATGTVTLTARILDTFPAIAKGWTVSG